MELSTFKAPSSSALPARESSPSTSDAIPSAGGGASTSPCAAPKTRAQHELRRLLTTLDKGIDLPTENITLRDWLRRWLKEVIGPDRRRATMERYRATINLHIAPAIGPVKLAELGPSHVHPLDAHHLRRDLSPVTIQSVNVVLSGTLMNTLRMELVHKRRIEPFIGDDVTQPFVSPLYRPGLNGPKSTAHEYLSFPLLLNPSNEDSRSCPVG